MANASDVPLTKVKSDAPLKAGAAESASNAKTTAKFIGARAYTRTPTNGTLIYLKLGRVKLGVVRTRTPEHRRRRPVVTSFLERKRSGAKRALGREPTDQPMRTAATRAVIDFAFVIDGVIAASIRVER